MNFFEKVVTEDGIVIGNVYDKYRSRNPIVKWMMNGFHQSLDELVANTKPQSIHEIGCGEGYWVIKWCSERIKARGSDFSKQIIDVARESARKQNLDADIFIQKSIYDIDSYDGADLMVCCEVLEHLEYPQKGLEALTSAVSDYLILSVPREPIWRVLNMCRGKYIRYLGNTPGHIQHWSRASFVRLVSRYFDIVEVKTPFPWVMLVCRKKQH